MEPLALLKKVKHVAVIGLSNNEEKYSYKIYQRLKSYDYDVYGVSLHLTTLGEDVVYQSLEAIGQPIDLVVFVVSPKVGYHYLDACAKLGIKHVWLQPGTYDEAFLEYARQLGLVTTCSCVLRQLPEKS